MCITKTSGLNLFFCINVNLIQIPRSVITLVLFRNCFEGFDMNLPTKDTTRCLLTKLCNVLTKLKSGTQLCMSLQNRDKPRPNKYNISFKMNHCQTSCRRPPFVRIMRLVRKAVVLSCLLCGNVSERLMNSLWI